MPTKDEILKVRMPADMMTQIRELAEQDDVPVSQIVRKLIKERLDQKEPKPQARRKEDKKA